MSSCSVNGCMSTVKWKGMCGAHYQRFRIYGRADEPFKKRREGTGKVTAKGYIRIAINHVHRFAHDLVAERALGKALPPGAVVHHVDEDKTNNEPSNLVICPDQKYHGLLHKRQRALDACGNANYLKCNICKKYDDPTNMYVHEKAGSVHRECRKLKRQQFMGELA